mmetsp:Transcript_28010/g.45755  ORF Transcript_28010/g.45755 Transcript_28010/m.45755 type:complete len:88 (+) Transcript_28010:1192-1455(+)
MSNRQYNFLTSPKPVLSSAEVDPTELAEGGPEHDRRRWLAPLSCTDGQFAESGWQSPSVPIQGHWLADPAFISIFKSLKVFLEETWK